MHALQQLYAWRDQTARLEDESLAYVLPDHMLLQMAEVLPREMPGILACCSPIPPLIKQELHHLHRIILQARELPLVEVRKSLYCNLYERKCLKLIAKQLSLHFQL